MWAGTLFKTNLVRTQSCFPSDPQYQHDRGSRQLIRHCAWRCARQWMGWVEWTIGGGGSVSFPRNCTQLSSACRPRRHCHDNWKLPRSTLASTPLGLTFHKIPEVCFHVALPVFYRLNFGGQRRMSSGTEWEMHHRWSGKHISRQFPTLQVLS